MPSLILFYFFLLPTTVKLYSIRSTNAETDPATSNDWTVFADASAVPIDSGDSKTFSFNARTDWIAQGLPDNLFASSKPANQGSLFVNSNTNPVVPESGSVASHGLGPLLASLDISPVGSKTGSIVPEDKEDPLFSSDTASNVSETLAIVPEDQEHQLDSFIVTPSMPGTSVSISEDQGPLYSNPIIASSSSETEATIPEGNVASTIPGEQTNQVSSDSIHCNSRQTRDKGDICLPINDQVEPEPSLRQPSQDRPNKFIEPEQDEFEEPKYTIDYGPKNPWLANADDYRKRCSNTKKTLCCDGPSRLTQWVSNCFFCMFLFLLCYSYLLPPQKQREN